MTRRASKGTTFPEADDGTLQTQYSPTRSEDRTTLSAPKEQLHSRPRVAHQPLRANDDTLKSSRRTHIHGFPPTLGDLRLKWFEKLLSGSIRSFLQLVESFMARFVINTKAPKYVSSFLTLFKGKNETLHNYNKRYWELHNETEECSKELTVASYNLGMTPGEKLWNDLTLNLTLDLQDLMMQLEMYARMRMTSDKQNELWNTLLGSQSLWEEIVRNAISGGNVSSTRKRDTKQKTAEP
ncbi:hypothetical protein Acr_00g0094790 [Actinidia rufa]|uniref:Retrotransposon gag domain-containing protein n=1 Tax=Actinidia rufa TaxID=165716 RepID=A0A7J0DY82_9ERIC|nr:hypothetical protein Acr_00g0094790 [Actinidia rufa]